ncbi:DUF3817 domain-containing protein [Streptoalloteichus hindustanus]|uniref:Integral membrane protein n=1 Tax=Streptoalloteichus hindustanus TaxID=2017 RepID=A0A1M5AES3_STRHI|nr:DUF3817 domain-containing protein [Streptoalloteichus hindustanus]SHF28771.1 integral membrane protein [Streptoalloteichus hindustanus]
MNAALTRFRIAAYVVGVGLLALVLVAMPLKYFADQPLLVQVVGPVHGFLYAVYLLITFDLAVRSKWPVLRTLGVLVAGTIPFVSFVAERKVVRLARETAPAA